MAWEDQEIYGAPGMECALCGMPLERIPDPIWSHGPNRDPYCSQECLDLSTSVAHAIPSRIEARRRK